MEFLELIKLGTEGILVAVLILSYRERQEIRKEMQAVINHLIDLKTQIKENGSYLEKK